MVVCLSSGHAHLFQLAGDGLLGFLHGHTGEFLGIHQLTALAQIILLLKGMLRHIRPVNDLDHGNVMHLGIFKVTLVMAGHRHHRAGAVIGQDEVADKHRHFPAVYRVDGIDTLKPAAGLALVQLGAVHVALFEGLVDVRPDLFLVLHPVHEGLDDLAVGSQHHEGNAVDGFDTGGIDGEFAAAHQLEVHLHTGGLSDPVALNLLGGLGPVDFIQALQELFGKGGLVDDPLHHVLLDHRIAAPLGLAVDDFVVRKHGAQLFTPVHRHLDPLGIARLVQLLEDPLGPLVEGRVGGGNHLGPVVVKAQFLQLGGEGLDVLLGKAVGMVAGAHRVLLRRQAEGIIAHGVQHIVALHPLHAGHDVRCRVAFRVTGVEAHTRGVRKHIQHIVFRLGKIPYIRIECVVFLPIFVPLCFNGSKIVIHSENTSLK